MPAPPRLGGYPLQDAWCWVWLLLGGVCGGVVCLGYMYLAVYFVIFCGADFPVLWTCVMIHFNFLVWNLPFQQLLSKLVHLIVTLHTSF